MKNNTCKGVEVSALSLGTVQLGVNYGINNDAGKPDREASMKILDCALAAGVNALDTAAAYGDSEEIIGQWLKTIPEEKRPLITTKLKHLDHSSLENLRADVRRQLEGCKERLGLKTIPVLMLHSFEEYESDRENVRTVFEELKASGEIRFSGISAYAHHDYGVIAESGFDAVQIPLNIFDWRQSENGGLEKLRKSGMMIFVRSVYLQGLVFKDPANLAPEMEFCRETLEKFRMLCGKYNMTPAQLAISFALSVPGVMSLVLGCEKVEQVQQNAQLLDSCVTLSDEQMQEIKALFKDTDDHVLNPGTWVNAM